jgi:4-hydroxy-3-polyprenylbenzoate decarboxylase
MARIMETVIGITGASGVIYGIELLRNLEGTKHLIISGSGEKIIPHEVNLSLEKVKALADFYYPNDSIGEGIASGSASFDAMVICPCTTNSLSKIACGIADNLMTRAASVAIKEKRQLILVPRETPLSPIVLENMHKLSLIEKVTMLPAMPAFYPKPTTIAEQINFIVGRILDSLGQEHNLYKRWDGKMDG